MEKTTRLSAPKLAAAVLILGLGCVMAGCSSESTESTESTEPAVTAEPTDEPAEFTMLDIVNANSRDALLAKYDNVYVQIQDAYPYLTGIYVSKDTGFYEFSESAELFDAEDNWSYSETDGQGYLNYHWYAMDDEERAARIRTPESISDPVVDEQYTLNETIEQITDNGDGTITLVTQDSSESASDYLEQDTTEYPEEFYTSPQRLTYVLDKESLEILSCEEVVLAESGEIFFGSYTVTHNAAQPEYIQTMRALIDEFKNGDMENPKTIQMIYDYGTDQEEDYEITIDQKFNMSILARDGYDYFYSDPDKKEEYTGSYETVDVTIYAFQG